MEINFRTTTLKIIALTSLKNLILLWFTPKKSNKEHKNDVWWEVIFENTHLHDINDVKDHYINVAYYRPAWLPGAVLDSLHSWNFRNKVYFCHWIIVKCHIFVSNIIIVWKWADKRHCTFKLAWMDAINQVPVPLPVNWLDVVDQSTHSTQCHEWGQWGFLTNMNYCKDGLNNPVLTWIQFRPDMHLAFMVHGHYTKYE